MKVMKNITKDPEDLSINDTKIQTDMVYNITFCYLMQNKHRHSYPCFAGQY